jgi:hypothetical protein
MSDDGLTNMLIGCGIVIVLVVGVILGLTFAFPGY